VDLEKIEGILMRWSGNKLGANEDDLYKNYEWKGALLALSHIMTCPVINKPAPDYWYSEGLATYDLQYQLCQAGFKPLSSLVTRNLNKAQNFLNKHSHQVFIQPISSPENIYSFKNKKSEVLLTKIIDTIPIRLVEYPEGERLEAFVLQNVIFLADEKGIRATLEDPLVQILEHLSSTINISFLQVHLIKCRSDSYSCIGLNDVPNYEWCSDELREKINYQLIRALGIN
jgi:hypothetical protein